MAEIKIWMKEWLRQEMKEEDLDRRVNFASLSPPILPQGAGVLTSLQAQVVMAIKVGDRRFALSSIKRRGKIKKSVLDLFLSCLIFASFWHKARVFAENMLKKLIVADLSGFVHMRIMFLNAGCDFVMRRYWDPGGYLDSFACEGVDRYSGGDCECVVKNGVVLKQLKMLDESDFSVNDKLCHRMGHTTENILADILLLCCVDEGADVHQSAVLCCLGDIARVCHVHLQPRLSAADYCEKSYLHNEQKQMVLDNLKGYAVRALVNAVDRVETVAAANLSPVWQGGAALDLHKEVLVSNVVEEQAMEVDMVVEDRVDVETLTVIHPWPEAILLGFQHYLVMLGTSVIIPTALVPMIRYPQMGGGNDEKVRVIQTLLFVAGINTLFQSFFGTRLPAVIGGSYTFVAPTISIILASRYNGVADPHEKFLKIMRGIQGSLLVASALQIIIGFSGLWRNITRFLSPLAAVPLVALAGFGLYELGFPGAAKCIEIGLPMLIALIIFSQYIPHAIHAKYPVFDRFAVIFSVAIIWIYAHLLTVGGAYKHSPPKTQAHCRTDRGGLIGAAPWIRVPYPFQWGAPTFNAGEAFAMMVASFVSLVESTGTFIAVSRYASATPLPPSILSRGIGWQGIGILLDGFFGTITGSTVSVENAGLLALTKVGSRRVVQIAAGFMIFFSVLGKFGAVFASIPAPIFAALYCLFFAYVGSGGLSFLQFCNLNSFRTKFILGFSFFMGLSVPQYFNEYTAVAGYGPVHTNARWFNDMINVLFSSKAFVGGVVAFLLDCTLHKDSAARKDRGYHWWDKFRSFKTDTRSEEFYSLPFNLNKFFPSV